MGQDLNSLCDHIIQIWLDLRQDSNHRLVLGELSAHELLFSLLHADVLDHPLHQRSENTTSEDRQIFERVVKNLASELVNYLEDLLKKIKVSDRQISLAKADDWLGLSLVLEVPTDDGGV